MVQSMAHNNGVAIVGIHILNAQNKLTAHYEWFSACLNDTYKRCKAVMPTLSLDVVVKAGSYVIAEKGHYGYSPEAGIIYLTVYPENPAFCK